MTGFPIPSNEHERLRELRKLRFEEWGASTALSQLCAVAAKLLGTSISAVSLVGEDEQMYAGQFGLDVDRTAREVAFCAHTIMTSMPLVVENADNDQRFCLNPIVTAEPGLKSYLGIPLETAPGIRIGALCAVDSQPRSFNENDVRTLLGLSQIVVSILNSYRLGIELDEQLASAIALQNDMLPSPARLAQIQAHCPLDLSSYYNQRDGIGGDIWGIDVTGPQRVMMYVVDFTGHGVAAALNAARFHSFAHMMWQRTGRPESLLPFPPPPVCLSSHRSHQAHACHPSFPVCEELRTFPGDLLQEVPARVLLVRNRLYFLLAQATSDLLIYL